MKPFRRDDNGMISVPLYSHPFKPYFPNGANKLILGTMPPHRFCDISSKLKSDDVAFYYGSRDNGFWEIIEKITNTKLAYELTEEAIVQRKKLLDGYHIAIADMIQSFTRCGEGALDSSLCVYELQDILSLLNQNPTIKKIFFTSSDAEKYFRKHINKMGIYLSKQSKKENSFYFDGKSYTTYRLLSPSYMTNLANITLDDKVFDYKVLFS